ncbi:MAG: methylenetetrahydrofolate reductase [NAD(P)H] [Candidatus Poribacteria bacterium]
MKIENILKDKKRSISFEFFPPKTDQAEQILFDTIEKLVSFKPSYVSVTYGAGGSTRDKTMSTVQKIKEKTSFTVMPHLTCIGSERKEIAGILDFYKSIGIENILALRGDPPMGVTELPEIEDGFDYARDLIEFINTYGTFSIGAAAYPEKHKESPNIEFDMIYTKDKVEAGASFLITQMFFENSFFYGFLDRATMIGIDVPIIPGIMPITDLKKIKQLSLMCGASIPDRLNNLINKYGDSPEDSRKAGMEFTIEQCRNLIENDIKYFHFYTLNRWEAVSEIINILDLFPV